MFNGVVRVVVLLSVARTSVSFASNLPRVCIADGCMAGSWMRSLRADRFEAFLGVPFAKPPIGELRFADPVPNDPWREDELDATGRIPRPACMQHNLFLPERGVEGSEDCLYLNVYRPVRTNRNSSEPLDTIVYIHGGGYLAGYISPLAVGPEKLMDQHIILVVIPYRLGAFGFLSTGDDAASGNYGLKDQRLALRWVHRNIRDFGGDPGRVTIMGHSAGAASVQLQLMHRANEGLFQRAISLSGNALAPWSTPLEDPKQLALQQALLVGIGEPNRLSSADLVEALRSVDADLFVSRSTAFTAGPQYPAIVYGPVVEKNSTKDAFLTARPQDLWADGVYLPVPWLTGIVPNDGFVFSAPLLKESVDCTAEDTSQQFIRLLSLLKAPKTTKSLWLLSERFIANKSSIEGGCVAKNNIDSLTKIFNEALFIYPLVRSIQQQVHRKPPANDVKAPAPALLYRFNYKGNLSYSSVLAPQNDQDFGVVHCDELNYIFRAPALFPDFRRDSAEEKVSQKFVKLLVQFAHAGTIESEIANANAADGSFPKALEFTNSNDVNRPLDVRTIDLYDQQMVEFWTKFYETKKGKK
ncbi:juvenile hormone esterase-like [Anopheles bellator]|uniref:juvenile hormone esterase-like n=1 Tax=Anopheles bellator TaxID=139047 RepID=UPI002648D8D3|nr:juvenile hormone esterase-like [Anopheles bellator]